jgi:hypothetical protein
MMKLGYPLLSDRRFPVRAVILSLAFEKRCCCFGPSVTKGLRRNNLYNFFLRLGVMV